MHHNWNSGGNLILLLTEPWFQISNRWWEVTIDLYPRLCKSGKQTEFGKNNNLKELQSETGYNNGFKAKTKNPLDFVDSNDAEN